MQRQLEDVLDAWDGDRYGPTTEIATAGMGIDLADRGDEFVLTADVPGFETDDIDLRLADDTLHITAERTKESTEEENESYIRNERTRRSMSRAVQLPESVDEEAVEASYRNGVLTVTLPKTEPTEPEETSIDIE
ncbi:Hsp20/alpha crystallin family protein [Natrinema sp. CBA1119]|uniref:Hsp20/alpha crystallin family protein n=1 Tax=Natrinema sp. CBA1119 TaxID=1608465 RepID=UPI0020D270E7|nr:Hsp20/alpha crystallin family protein [Natrinema sp. CBA1119]